MFLSNILFKRSFKPIFQTCKYVFFKKGSNYIACVFYFNKVWNQLFKTNVFFQKNFKPIISSNILFKRFHTKFFFKYFLFKVSNHFYQPGLYTSFQKSFKHNFLTCIFQKVTHVGILRTADRQRQLAGRSNSGCRSCVAVLPPQQEEEDVRPRQD